MGKAYNELAKEAADAKPMNLIQKLAAIRRELDHIEKKGKNEHFGYKFMRAEDVAGDIGDRFATVNIVIGIENGKCEVHALDKGFMVVTECTYKFIDGDSGESLTVWSCGAGYNSSDKGIYKARTGALKYALTQALCMRVGDDAEADDDGRVSNDKKKDRAGATENGGVETSNGILASDAQRKFLLKSAKSAMGEKEGKAWVAQRMADLGITSADTFQMHNWQMLLNELNQLKAGEDSQVPAEETDIPW